MIIKGLKISLMVVIMIVGFISEGQPKGDFSERVAKEFIRRFPNPDTIHWVGQTKHFSWQAGYIMFANTILLAKWCLKYR